MEDDNQGPGVRPTLLLVDDCVPHRDLYERVLEREFEVLTATRARDALALIVSRRPDVVVSDVLMPDLDEWEICTQIKSRAETAHIPVILLTGLNQQRLPDQAAAVGAAAALTKPCSAELLRNVILSAIQRRLHGADAERGPAIDALDSRGEFWRGDEEY
jgi:CheY-like chemotaxis protein